MRVVVLGAAGKTGREVVREAMDAGHDVVAFVHREGQLQAETHLSVIVGDAEDQDSIARALIGCDAVISTLGHTSLKASSALTSAMTSLVATLPDNTRVVTLTGFGVVDANDPKTPLTGRLLTSLIKLAPGGMYQDGVDHVAILKASSLNWTVIRASVLTSGAGNHRYELGYFSLGPSATIARRDVALAMVEQLGDSKWSRTSPMIRS